MGGLVAARTTATRRAAVAAAVAAAAWMGVACCRAQAAREVHVLAAADLQPVMPALEAAFEKAKGIKLTVSFGSSATLATQILNGAPADIFLAADESFPHRIVAAGLADSPAPIPYARGTLVLWARKDSRSAPVTLATLREGRFQSLAIANPEHAPYGRAAVAALKSMGLYDSLKPKLVQAENIAQTAQFVESGNAQLGLISLTSASTAHMKEIGSYVRMPADSYPALRQAAVVMKKGANAGDAHIFLDWLTSPAVQKTLPQYGLDPAE